MNFEEWFKKYDSTGAGVQKDKCRISCHSAWFNCKEEVLKIIFLNTKVNGKKTINIEEIVKNIEEL